jgi:Fe-S oxidoreductase
MPPPPALRLALGLVTALALALFLSEGWRRLAPLRALRRAGRNDRRGERIDGLERYGFGQERLVDPEERWAGRLHVLVFVAFLVLSVRTATLWIQFYVPGFAFPGLAPGSVGAVGYGWAKEVAVAGAALGAAGLLWRRLVTRPARLAADARTRAEGIAILLLILALMATEWAIDRPGSSAAFAHLVLVLAFLAYLPLGKHFHVLTALPNVFLRRLPPEARLERLDLEAEEARFGAATARDLSRKEGWDVLSCTECGRCETRCPTVLTGKPLSHREVNRSLRRHLLEVGPALRAVASAGDAPARDAALATLPPLSSVVAPDTFWACTTCGWCETSCPVFIENVPRLVELRRQAVQVDAAMPDEAARLFRSIETQGNPWGLGANRRTEWCDDLDVPRASSGAPFEWLFFVGCAGAYDDRQRKVSRAIVRILRAAGVRFAILGDEETCTGDAARRLGNEYLFQQQAAALVAAFERYGVRKVLVQCPHCLNAIANELPDFGGRYEVVHHAELIARLVAEGRLAPGSADAAGGLGGAAVAWHDPCYLGRWAGAYEPPRRALAAAGVVPLEPPRTGRTALCCGAGGGRAWLEERIGTRINRERTAELLRTLGPKGGVVATGCPFCLSMLKDGIVEEGAEGRARALDVAEIVAMGLPRG